MAKKKAAKKAVNKGKTLSFFKNKWVLLGLGLILAGVAVWGYKMYAATSYPTDGKYRVISDSAIFFNPPSTSGGKVYPQQTLCDTPPKETSTKVKEWYSNPNRKYAKYRYVITKTTRVSYYNKLTNTCRKKVEEKYTKATLGNTYTRETRTPKVSIAVTSTTNSSVSFRWSSNCTSVKKGYVSASGKAGSGSGRYNIGSGGRPSGRGKITGLKSKKTGTVRVSMTCDFKGSNGPNAGTSSDSFKTK